MYHQDSNESSTPVEFEKVPTENNGLTAEERDSETDRKEIKKLHDSVCYYTGLAVLEATRIGEILTRRKELVGHGNWIPWLKANVEFTEATACNYMRLFEYRDWLKSKTPILHLSRAAPLDKCSLNSGLCQIIRAYEPEAVTAGLNG
jgi:hypothetical protein